MNLQIALVFCTALIVMTVIVILCFRAGKASILGELGETRKALRLYRKYVRVQESGSAKQAREYEKSVKDARKSMSRRDYDVLVMKATTLAQDREREDATSGM